MAGVNDFAFKIATANGTGSASANGLIMQAIFRMGVPVTGKNVFPSNIQGLPTWYEIRVNKDGYTARTPNFDLMVALNAATYAKDVAEVRSGGWLLYDSSWPLDDRLKRPDVTYLGVPLAAYAAGVLLYSGSSGLFWRALAYVAVLHFVRQQYGWVALCRRKLGPASRLDRVLDDAAIYSATLYPLVYWHANLPRGERIQIGTAGTLEEILYGPSHTADGTMNFVGALRRAMSTTGYTELKEFQRVEVVVQ